MRGEERRRSPAPWRPSSDPTAHVYAPPCCRSSTGSSPATADAVACTRARARAVCGDGMRRGERLVGDTASMTCLPTASLQAIALCRLRPAKDDRPRNEAIARETKPLRDSLRDAGRKCDAQPARIRIFTRRGNCPSRDTRPSARRSHLPSWKGRTVRPSSSPCSRRTSARCAAPSGCAKRGELCRIRPAAHLDRIDLASTARPSPRRSPSNRSRSDRESRTVALSAVFLHHIPVQISRGRADRVRSQFWERIAPFAEGGSRRPMSIAARHPSRGKVPRPHVQADMVSPRILRRARRCRTLRCSPSLRCASDGHHPLMVEQGVEMGGLLYPSSISTLPTVRLHGRVSAARPFVWRPGP